MALVKSTGTAPCLLGKTWGYDDTGIWTSDGCGGEFLAGKSEEVRMAALNAVVQSDDPSVLEQIRPLVNDSSELVRRIATRMVEMRENRLARGVR